MVMYQIKRQSFPETCVRYSVKRNNDNLQVHHRLLGLKDRQAA